MQSIRQVARLNETELEKVIPSNASWHTDYRDTAYIYIGGLPFELSEGDILTIFSQYGNPVHVNLVRDKETGKSRGFAFLKYEDQRSCDLAVDNLSGGGVMGRVMSVDHTRYKKKEGEIEGVGEAEDTDDGEDEGRRKRRKSESESEEDRPLVKEEIELQKLLQEHDEDDPMKAYLVEEKRKEVADALKVVAKKPKDGEKKRKHRHHRRPTHYGDSEGRERKTGRSRRERSDDEEDPKRRVGRRRRERSGSRSGKDDTKVRSRKHQRRRSASPSSDEDRHARKHRSRREDESDDEDRRRKRDRKDDLHRRMREHSFSDRSRSRERGRK